MQNIMNLQRRGYLTEQQLLHAYKFAKNPNSYLLAPTFYRVLHDAIVKEEPLEAMEKRRGWPARSAKAMISLILHAMQEVGGSHSEPVDEEEVSAKERLAFVTADGTQDTAPIMQQFKFTHHEARLFLVLKRSANQTASKDAILTRLYADRIDEAPDIKIIDVFVCKMRKKLAKTTWRINTIWGEGYQLEDTGDPNAPQAREVKEPDPPNERDVLWYKLHVCDDVSYRQIARDTGAQPSTVLRAVTRLLNNYTDEQIDEAVKKLAA